MNRLILVIGAVFALGLVSCDNDDDTDDTTQAYDRGPMLENYSQNIILPRLQDFHEKTASLHESVEALKQKTNSQNLAEARESWKQAYQSFQYCNAFNFGPGDQIDGTFLEKLGTFPPDTAQIETYISQNDTTFNNFNRNTRGFTALDYMLFNRDENATVQYLNGQNRMNYVLAVSHRIKTVTDKILADWQQYASSFESNLNVEAGSPTSLLYNEFVKSYEAVKNFKTGLPLGKRPGQQAAEPYQAQAYFSGYSNELMQAHLESIYQLYEGIGVDGSDREGLADFVESTYGGQSLAADTREQWSSLTDAFENLPQKPIHELVLENQTEMDDYYTELSKQTRFFKSDMSSKLGISITYDSGDGD
jgi:predicted lipoprotein